MVDFRYAQFCPLTRAVEILGERWTILILRELFLGPKRFSDLKSALNGVSPSVLADRLTRLEERGIILRRELPPPAASVVYELDDAGRALRPLLVELTRWGLRFMGSPAPDDSFRPEWLTLGFEVFACSGASEEIGAKIRIEDGGQSLDLYVRGGAGGTVVSRTPIAHDVTISAAPMEILMFTSGLLAPGDDRSLRCEGDIRIVRRIPSLFDFRPTPSQPPGAPEVTPNNQPAVRSKARQKRTAAAPGSRQGGVRP